MSRGPAKSFDRSAVLEQAMIEFWKRGYSATSISTLREVTGLGAKSLYDTFGGKREVFLACLEHYAETVLPRSFDEQSVGRAPRAALTRILKVLISASPKRPAKGCLIGVAAAELEEDPELAAALKRYLDRIQHSLQRVIEALPLADDAPAPSALASMLMALLQGVHLVSRVDGTRTHTVEAIRSAEMLIDSHCQVG